MTLGQAAAATDALANLNDELKTAYWFARQGEASPRGDAAPRGHAAPLIDLQIRRAALTARKLHPAELFEIAVPRSAFAAAGLVVVAGLLAWISPRFGYPQAPRAEAVTTVAAQAPTAARAARNIPRDQPADGKNDQALGAADATWAKLEATINTLGQGVELYSAAAAIKSRDAARAVELLEEFDRKREFARARSAGSIGANPAPASPDLLSRLQELFSPSGKAAQPTPDGGASDELARALDLAQKLDDEMRAVRANNPATHSVEEGNNPLQAAISLERHGPREARRSQTQGGDFAGATDVEGGAMGRRVTQSTIGAGGKPSGSETSDNNNIEAEPALGKRTMRLAAQLERVKIAGAKSHGDDAQGIGDGFYAATRAQQAQLSYQNAPRRARYVSESAMSGERVPLAYRGAVKDYFLNLNQRDP